MLENTGFADDAGLEPRQCPRCKALNAYDALYMRRARVALVEEATRKLDESTDEAKKGGEYLELVRQLKENLGLS